MSKNENVVITKETIRRLLRDVKDIMKNPLVDNGIYYIHDEEDMLKGYALIIGPQETPYFGGNYFFELKYPSDYPHSPPKVNFCTNGDGIRFNPNLYTNGKVCISLLNTWRGEQWTSCQSISTVLLNLCTLLNSEPLLNEPGVNKTHNDFAKYHQIIEYKNIDTTILKMVNKNAGYYPVKFNAFYSIVKENFGKNCAEILKFIERKMEEKPEVEKINTGMYGMTVVINYKKLHDDFLETCKLL
jgi:ubiquitin-conjugating enzyme E2 Z